MALRPPLLGRVTAGAAGSHRLRALFDAGIEYARNAKNWPLLEEAVEHKMDEQAAFVECWRANVTPHKTKVLKNQQNADLRSVETAELTCGITQQTVSRWARGLPKMTLGLLAKTLASAMMASERIVKQA